MAILSKGITLSYTIDKGGADYTTLTNLQEIPDLGGEAEGIDITTLADPAFMYMDGIKEYGDSLEFVFLYEKEQFIALHGLNKADWKVELPDGTVCKFSGSCSVKLSGVGVNAALNYTLAIKPTSEMLWN